METLRMMQRLYTLCLSVCVFVRGFEPDLSFNNRFQTFENRFSLFINLVVKT